MEQNPEYGRMKRAIVGKIPIPMPIWSSTL